MVQGPVRVETPDGATVESDRFMVAICTCRRSKTYPLCDTSHRKRRRPAKQRAEDTSALGPCDEAQQSTVTATVSDCRAVRE